MVKCQMEYWRKNNAVRAEEELTAILTKEINKQIISDMEKKIYTKAKCSGNLEAVIGKVACGPNTAPKKIHRQYHPTNEYDDEIVGGYACDTKKRYKKKTEIKPKKFTASNYGVNQGPFDSSMDFFNNFNNNKRYGNI